MQEDLLMLYYPQKLRAEDLLDPFGIARATFCAWALTITFWFPSITQKKARKKRRRG